MIKWLDEQLVNLWFEFIFADRRIPLDQKALQTIIIIITVGSRI